MRQQDVDEARWERRPGVARSVRVVVFGGPVLASFGAALAVRTLLPQPTGLLARAAALAVLVAVSTLVLVVVDRLGRRALPLVTLLELNMLFPDRAPSRLGVARDAIRRRPIEEQLRRVQDAGADPGAVAREILALVAAMSAHDRPTRGHAERVRMFTDLLAEQMRVPSKDRDLLRWASILHDIGKLRVPASLLNKPAKPTDDEWVLLKSHPAHGAEMAGALLPWLGEWGAVIAEHHERYDGSGYPTGIAGRDISLGARIVSVADAYDVMTAARAYKRPVSRAAACRELVRFSGTQFDPTVVRAMVAVGAPRLRRAQGLVAWIADLPLVATGTVPAATVARVVGAGALATGAVTGGAVVGGAVDIAPRLQPPAAASSSVAGGGSDASAQQARAGGAAGPVQPDRDRTAARVAPATDVATAVPTGAVTTPTAPTATTTQEAVAADPGGGAVGSGGHGTSERVTDTLSTPRPAISSGSGSGSSGSGSLGSGSSGSGPTLTSGSSGSASPSPTSAPKASSATLTGTVGSVTGGVGTVTGSVGTTVGTVTGTVTDTVGGVVSDPLGTVTGVVSDPVGTVDDTLGTVTDTVGTVTDTLGTVTGTVGGVVGGLTGSSGTGSKKSGLLGGLLGGR